MQKVGFKSLPGSSDQKSVLSWHFYWNPVGKSAVFQGRIQDSKRLNVVPFVSEFDITWDGSLRRNLEVDEGGLQVNDSLDTMKRLDSDLISWLGWEYKTYIKKTGYGEGIFDSINQVQRPEMIKLYSRPFAQSVSGKIIYMNYDDQENIFKLSWEIPPFSPSKSSTVISTGRKWHYPNGMVVTITPNHTTSYLLKDNLIYVNAQSRQFAQIINLTLSRK